MDSSDIYSTWYGVFYCLIVFLEWHSKIVNKSYKQNNKDGSFYI